MRKPKYLSFDELIKFISKEFLQIPEHRVVGKVKYELHDCLLSGLAMMFFQHPSLLKYQEKMKQGRGSTNLERLFQTSTVPSDTQMREILDGVEKELVRVLLKKIFERTRRYGVAARWASESDYLVVLDATQYFSSEAIQCEHCLTRTNKKGETRYCHQVLPATIVKPGTHQILPLDVEEICNSDGAEKQDCEVNAAKRLIKRLRKEHAKLQITIGGDDIYSREPMVNELRANRCNFILVAKPTSHPEMFSEIEQLTKVGGVDSGEYEESKGKKVLVTRYRIARQVPLNGNGQCIVNFFEIWQEDKATSQQLYHNSWVTNLEVTSKNVANLASRGRARWKIENEGFNVQKNSGYELAHNYGHGQNNLSMVFYLLNILAFTLHQILEITDELYLKAKAHEGGLRYLWEKLRTLFDIWPLKSWARMLEICLEKEPVFDSL